jgi:hypothetical protein
VAVCTSHTAEELAGPHVLAAVRISTNCLIQIFWRHLMLFRDAPGTSTAPVAKTTSPRPYWIDTVDLSFDLDPAKTRVLNRKMRLRRNTDLPGQPLRLDGEELNLARVLVNGAGTSFKMDGSQLVLENLPEGPDPSSWKSSPPARPRRTPS